ncbi:site-specific DNA-methyltransferase [Pseudomonas sp. Irchel 3A7]|uniref:site-specific DNA-methyltransferase n=1 Tax=Pseudomonas sp. Irchel 3A7 TaxID=2008913 RepID=UPI001C47488E|nr:site-specific DNA-methyltransferase [Pseudomonas sp. Irchel 3A7]
MNKAAMNLVTLQDGESANIVNENIEQLKSIFPEVFGEGGINFETLRQLLGDAGVIDEGEEKYGLNWHGKKKARQIALSPSTGTLLPCPEESVDWDTTKNLFVEGDNLEVLKLLQRSYTGKVKMIYIDPPYNTGNEFIYPDKFQDNLDTYLKYTGQIDDQGFKLSSNTEASGRKHTNWLSMMYPRLKISQALLRVDGVIFISIGNDEHANLKKVCDEIFGEENFIASFSRMMKSGGAKGKFFTPNIDYILAYAKNVNELDGFRSEIPQEQIKTYYNKIEVSGARKGESYGEERLYKASLDARPNQRYWIQCPDGSFVIPPGNSFPSKVSEGEKIIPNSDDGVWKWTYTTYKDELDKGNIVFKETSTSALVDERNNQSKYNIYNKLWLTDQQEKGKVPSDFIGKYENRQSSAELKELGIPFDFAKPVNLIRYLLEIARTKGDDIILDFFSGSCSTAHAVFQQNAYDSQHRRCISVQLPELTPDGSEARKLGFANIADIGKERIRRSAKKIVIENPGYVGDFGFKAFKLASSSIKAWVPNRDDLEETLLSHQEHLIEGRTEQDVLYELLIKRGIDLAVPVESKIVSGKNIYSIGYGALFVCLDESIAHGDVEMIAQGILKWHEELSPSSQTHVFFRDSAFIDDVTKTNMAAILEQNGITHVRSL